MLFFIRINFLFSLDFNVFSCIIFTNIFFRKEIKMENKQYDVIVVGGGFTGCAAALSASRNGMKVLLTDSSGYLGGAASNNLIFPFMPYYTNIKDADNKTIKQYLSSGILSEIISELKKDGYQNSDMEFMNEGLKLVLDEKLTAAGVDVLFHATLCGVKKEGTHIESVSFATKAGVLEFSSKTFIDCTGDADLCFMSGCTTVLGRPSDSLCQPMTLCFRVINVNKTEFWKHIEDIRKAHKEWLTAGKFTNPREDILVFDYPIEGVLHFNTTRVVKLNPVDPYDVTKAEMEARRQVRELMNFFRETKAPGMEKASLMYTASSIGVRESRMLEGEYVLTGEDLVACTKFDDSIAAGNYDIDIHNPEGAGTSHYYFKDGTWYTIPYRTLVPKRNECDNLLVGGRCISTTHEAQASIRIMPICCTTGEAAGVGAAVAVKSAKSVQDADVNEIQAILIKSGAFIGI